MRFWFALNTCGGWSGHCLKIQALVCADKQQSKDDSNRLWRKGTLLRGKINHFKGLNIPKSSSLWSLYRLMFTTISVFVFQNFCFIFFKKSQNDDNRYHVLDMCPKHHAKHFRCTLPIFATTLLASRSVPEEAEAQRNKMTCPGSPGRKWQS